MRKTKSFCLGVFHLVTNMWGIKKEGKSQNPQIMTTKSTHHNIPC